VEIGRLRPQSREAEIRAGNNPSSFRDTRMQPRRNSLVRALKVEITSSEIRGSQGCGVSNNTEGFGNNAGVLSRKEHGPPGISAFFRIFQNRIVQFIRIGG
jgi:hypothetical protein